MIILKRLKLNNFLSHVDTVIDFHDNEKVLFDGASGSGKTSLVEAITWCLYGVGRVANRDLVRRGATIASVELTLLDGETVYQITRTTTDKAKNTLSILTGNTKDKKLVAIGRMGLKDMQTWIEKDLLNASYMLFVNSIAYVQDNNDTFVKQTATRRKEILLEIIGGGDYSLLYEKARDRLSEEQNSVATVEAEIGMMKKNLSDRLVIAGGLVQSKIMEQAANDGLVGAKKVLDEATSNLNMISSHKLVYENWKSQKVRIEDDVTSLLGKINHQTVRIDQILSTEKNKPQIEEEVKTLKTFMDNLPLDLEARVLAEQERKMKLSQIMSNRPAEIDYDFEIAQLNKYLIPLIKDSGKCPSGDLCPFIAPIQGQIDSIEQGIQRKKSDKAGLEMKQRAYTASITAIGNEVASPSDYSLYAEAKATSKELERYRSILASFEQNAKIVDELRLNIATLQDEISAKRLEIPVIQNSMIEAEEKIAKLPELKSSQERAFFIVQDYEKKLSDFRYAIIAAQSAHDDCEKLKIEIPSKEKSIAVSRENINALLLAKDAFGPKGLTAVVIDYLIPQLEERINIVLSQLSNFRISIETQRPNSTGDGTVEGLFLEIYNEQGACYDYDGYSGGERVKIHIAISEALASLQKVGFRIFDEAVVALDPQSSWDFIAVMEKLQSKFNQMIVITHLQNIKDLFEKKISIVRVNGESKIASV